MKKNVLLNPFAKIEDKKLLTLGLIAYIIGIFIAFSMKIELQILRINPLSTIDLPKILLNHSVITICLSLAFFGIGKIINKKTRFIDILNTVFIAFIPYYISLFQNINGYLTNETGKVMDALRQGTILNLTPSFLFIMVTLVGLLFFIYYIYLLFIGFKTATHSKKIWHYVLFFATLVVIDLIVSMIINSI